MLCLGMKEVEEEDECVVSVICEGGGEGDAVGYQVDWEVPSATWENPFELIS